MLQTMYPCTNALEIQCCYVIVGIHASFYCRKPDPGALTFQYKAQVLMPTKVLACEAKLGHASRNSVKVH